MAEQRETGRRRKVGGGGGFRVSGITQDLFAFKNPGTKTCRGCQQGLPRASFARCERTRCGLQSRCRSCQSANTSRRQAERRAFVGEWKMTVGCMDCGFNKWSEALDFDHRDPTTKKFAPSDRLLSSWLKLKEEIAKCDVVCANCHRHRTYERGKNGGDGNG